MSEVKFNGTFGNYGLYQKNENSKPQVQEQEVKQEAPQVETKNVAPEKMLDVLSFMGAQNYAQVSSTKGVNPAKFLSEERIGDIENSMKAFEAGVEKYAGAIRAEFGSSLSEDTVLSLAANAFALE